MEHTTDAGPVKVPDLPPPSLDPVALAEALGLPPGSDYVDPINRPGPPEGE